MKLKHTLSVKPKSGMTLLELTVVILVLLSLISILFIGARAWKKGSDRAANILNIRNVQQAIRGHANMRSLVIGDTLAATDIVGTGKYLNAPTPPNSDIQYLPGNYAAVVPGIGTLYLTPNYLSTGSADFAPAAATIVEW